MAFVSACNDKSAAGSGPATSTETSATTAATEISDSADSTDADSTTTTTSDPTSTTGTTAVDTTTGEPLVCIVDQGTAGEQSSWTYSYGILAETIIPDQLVVAPDGSITTALEFKGEIDLGAGVVNTHGRSYRFFTRYSAAGEFVWSSHIAADPEIQSLDIAVDCAGNVIVGGGFTGELDVQGKTLAAVPGEVTSGDITYATDDMFLIKFGPDGLLRWARRFGDDRGQRLHSIGVQSDGTIIVSGASNGTLELDDSSDTTPEGEPMVYAGLLAAFDPDGVLVWKRGYTSTGDVALINLAVSTDDRIFAYGHAGGDTDLGGGPVVLTDDPTFIVGFAPDGAHGWSVRFFDKQHEPAGVGTDTAGGVVFSGSFGVNAFVARYDQSGQLVWNRDLVREDHADLGSFSIDALVIDDKVLIGGGLPQGAVDFGGGALVTPPDQRHPFLARYDLAGAHVTSVTYEAATYAWFISGDRGPDGELVFVGGFRDTLDLGDGPRLALGKIDLFIHRIKP